MTAPSTRRSAALPPAGWCPHLDHDGLPRGRDIDLLGAVDVQVAQVGLELGVGGLQVEQSLQGMGN